MIVEAVKTVVLGVFLTVAYLCLSVLFEDRFWLQVAEGVQ